MYKRKTIFHFTDIDSLISIILEQRILCSSVKTKLSENKDFLQGQHLAPLVINNLLNSYNIEEKARVFSDSVFGAIVPLIVNSYIFSATSSLGNSHHWKKYADKDDGGCLKIDTSVFREHSTYLDEGMIYYNNIAFKNKYPLIFLSHLLDDNIRNVSDRATKAFMKAVVFSKYVDYEDDNEYRFWFGDLVTLDEYDRRKLPDLNIPPLAIPIATEQLIKNIYFRSEGRRTEFLDRMGSTKEFWTSKVKLVS